MKRNDTISSIFWLVIGIAVSYGGYDLRIGGVHNPDSGFMIFWAGIVMTGLSLIVLVQSVRKKGSKAEEPFFQSNGKWESVIFTLLILILYTFAFNRLGFIISTFVLLLLLFRMIEPMRWLYVVPGSIFITMGLYGLFKSILEIQLPTGLLGF